MSLIAATAAAAAVPQALADSGQPEAEQRAGLLRVLVESGEVGLPAAPSFYAVIPTPVPTPTPEPTPTPTPKPKPKPKPYVDSVANAKAYARSKLGATQYACIDKVFYYESKWNPLAENRNSGAYGIPQALPGSKMAAFGSNWRTSPLTQVKWGIWYVNDRYGSACAAWEHIQATGWY
jgi:hypothetical protein